MIRLSLSSIKVNVCRIMNNDCMRRKQGKIRRIMNDCMKRKQGKNTLVIRRFKYNFLPTSFLLLLLRKAIFLFSVAGSNRYFLKHAMAAMAILPQFF